MLGLLINKKESEELIYLLKREMDELLYDLKDDRINQVIKHSMEERYDILFSLFKRIAPAKDCLLYTRKSNKQNYKN